MVPDELQLKAGERCSAFARAQDLDPVGTAGSYEAFVLVELLLPWPRDVTDDERVAPIVAAVGERERVQALVPRGGHRRLIVYRRGGGRFTQYRRAEWFFTSADEVAACLGTGFVAVADAVTDVLVCTHGRRDMCCGSLGTRLARQLPELGHDVRVWRTSHTGGHRFAPTAIILPTGQLWAYLDVATLRQIVHRQGEVADIEHHYRGCAAFDSPATQAAERAAFVAEGWSWLNCARSATELGPDCDGTRVRIEFASPAGRAGAYEATVRMRRSVPVPDCGMPIEMAKKSEPEWEVVEFAACPPANPPPAGASS